MPLGRLDDTRGWWMKHDPAGLPSQTTWKVMGRADGLTWLALEPLTGRTHQLRVHCSEMGFPILGDNIYGSAPRHAPGMHLHAREIVVPLYRNKPPIKVDRAGAAAHEGAAQGVRVDRGNGQRDRRAARPVRGPPDSLNRSSASSAPARGGRARRRRPCRR